MKISKYKLYDFKKFDFFIRDTNEEVKTQRQFVNFATAAPLLPSDINKYQEYGGKKIKFTVSETTIIVTFWFVKLSV